MFVQGLRVKRLLEYVDRPYHHYVPHINHKLTSSLRFKKMEGLQGITGAEGGSDPEFHDIPSHSTINTNIIHSENPISGTMERTELPILLRIYRRMVGHYQLVVLRREVLPGKLIICWVSHWNKLQC